jgi:TonB family protein
MKEGTNIIVYISISIILHILITLFVYTVPESWLPKDNLFSTSLVVEKAPVSIELIEDKNTQQIVRQAPVPESQLDKTSKDKARFLSAASQRVLLETKARLTGKTENNLSTPKYQQEIIQKKLTKIHDELKDLKNLKDQDGTLEVQTLNGRKKSEYKPLNLYPNNQKYGVSTLGETVPDDISVGDFTALNTDQFQFYTFYARIEDLVRFRWESKVREAIDQLNRYQALKNVSQSEWVTHLEFQIDEKGVLRKALLLKESGVSRFDQAAILAFQDAKVFPNPPKEMLKEDGLIHLRYSFQVNYSPTYMAK